VRQFVRQYRCELPLIVRCFDCSAIDEHKSAGQCKGVHGLVIHAMKFKWILHTTGREFGSQPRPQLREVRIYLGSVARRQLFGGIERGLLPHLNILLRREHVPSGLQLCALRPSTRRNRKGYAKKKGSARCEPWRPS
jgi:hypothetical protein